MEAVKVQEIEMLTAQDKSEIDFWLMGQIVYNQTFRLSRRVNTELLEPISQWLSDDDWMIRFKVCERDTPNWSEYKRKQREWNKHQRQLFADRMKAYWQEVTRRRNLRQEIAAIIPRTTIAKTESHSLIADTAHLTAILEPLSPPGEKKAETREKFIQARSLSTADILPWRLIIASDLKKRETQAGTTTLSNLQTYFPENKKKDVAAKLIHLLLMESEGMVRLSQSEYFGEITIEPSTPEKNNLRSGQLEGSFTIIDQSADEYLFNWHDLTDTQRNRVIADLKDNKILCKTG
jgi:hypothetical protein